jgi:hypothetical protein
MAKAPGVTSDCGEMVVSGGVVMVAGRIIAEISRTIRARFGSAGSGTMHTDRPRVPRELLIRLTNCNTTPHTCDLFLPFLSVGEAGFGVTYAENEHVFPAVCRQGHRYKSSEHLVA